MRDYNTPVTLDHPIYNEEDMSFWGWAMEGQNVIIWELGPTRWLVSAVDVSDHRAFIELQTHADEFAMAAWVKEHWAGYHILRSRLPGLQDGRNDDENYEEHIVE